MKSSLEDLFFSLISKEQKIFNYSCECVAENTCVCE